MFKINIEYKYGVLFVRLIGNLNKITSNLIEEKLIPIIERSGIKNLVYNFSELNSIDDIGCQSLMKGYNTILNNHGNVLVVNNRFNLEYFKETKNELSALNILKV